MANLRTTIRSNLVTALTGLSTTGARVYQSRVYPIDNAKLPGLILYTRNEVIEYVSMERTTDRSLTVSVEAYVKGTAGHDATIDDIAAEVEVAIAADTTLGGLAQDTRMTSIDVDHSGDGDQPVAIAVITVEIDYTAAEGAPTF